MRSAGQMTTNSIGNVNQAINKQRKNTDPLIKFLLSHKYYQQKLPMQQPMPVADEFHDFVSYQQTFQVSLIEKDFIKCL